MQARPRSRSSRVEEDAAAEAGDHGREVQRGPHAVDVHVVYPGIDVVAAGTHLVEAEGLEAVRLGAPSGHRVHAHLGVALALELPDLMALGRLDDAWGPVGQGGGQPSLEHMGRLDHVVVDRNHRVAHLPGLGLGEEQIAGGCCLHVRSMPEVPPPAPGTVATRVGHRHTWEHGEGRCGPGRVGWAGHRHGAGAVGFSCECGHGSGGPGSGGQLLHGGRVRGPAARRGPRARRARPEPASDRVPAAPPGLVPRHRLHDPRLPLPGRRARSWAA